MLHCNKNSRLLLAVQILGKRDIFISTLSNIVSENHHIIEVWYTLSLWNHWIKPCFWTLQWLQKVQCIVHSPFHGRYQAREHEKLLESVWLYYAISLVIRIWSMIFILWIIPSPLVDDFFRKSTFQPLIQWKLFFTIFWFYIWYILIF